MQQLAARQGQRLLHLRLAGSVVRSHGLQRQDVAPEAGVGGVQLHGLAGGVQQVQRREQLAQVIKRVTQAVAGRLLGEAVPEQAHQGFTTDRPGLRLQRQVGQHGALLVRGEAAQRLVVEQSLEWPERVEA